MIPEKTGIKNPRDVSRLSPLTILWPQCTSHRAFCNVYRRDGFVCGCKLQTSQPLVIGSDAITGTEAVERTQTTLRYIWQQRFRQRIKDPITSQ